MAKQIIDLYPQIMPELPSCPPPMLLQYTRNTIREFCEQTQAWKCDLDAINVLADVDSYDLDGQPSFAEIIVPTHVEQDSIILEPGIDYIMPSRNLIALTNAPQADKVASLVIQVALRPKATGLEVCEDLFNDWFQVWAYGAMSKLMIMGRKPWSNPQQAQIYHTLYWNGINTVRVDCDRGHMNQTLAVTPGASWLGE